MPDVLVFVSCSSRISFTAGFSAPFFRPIKEPLRPKFFSTSDAGDDWVALPQPPAFVVAGKGGFSELAFRGPGEGWMGGFAQQSSAYSTIDGGVTWQAHELPLTVVGKGGFAEGSARPGGNTFTCCRAQGCWPSCSTRMASPIGLTSFDGGSTWRRLAPPPGNTGYSDFIFQDTFHWWAMRFGTLFKSSDAGQTWKQVSLQMDDWDYILQVIDAKHAWAQLAATFPGSRPAARDGSVDHSRRRSALESGRRARPA